MATRNCAKYLILAVLALACTVQEPIQTQAPDSSEPAASDIIPGKATIEFSEDMIALIEEDLEAGKVQTKSAGLNAALQELGIISMHRVFPYAGKYEGRTRRAGLHRFYRVIYAKDVSSTKAVMDLSSVPGVVSVTPAHKLYKRAVAFNDPYFPNQWHYINKTTAGADINVQGVWEQYTTGDPRVIVCVVDESVDPTHPDLQANLWKDAQGHIGYDYVRNTADVCVHPEGEQVKDGSKWVWNNGDTGHGTHVAGTIAAVNNNGIGVCGIAGGDYAKGIPGVRVQSCPIFSGAQYADDEQAAAAMKWGADNGAVISQNSWGPSKVNIPLEQYDPDMKAAIDYFIENAGCDDDYNQLPGSPMKGGLVFFAAGNEKYSYDPYGAYEPVIAVGATGPGGKGASYSNYGSWVDVAAPGGEGDEDDGSDAIWSTVPLYVNDGGSKGGTVYTTEQYEGAYWAGTSMACPHASGVSALIVSYFGGPGFTADDAKAILYGGLGETISVKGYSSRKVGRKLDALASFQWALNNGYTPGGGGGEPGAPVVTLSKTKVSVKAHEEITVDFTATDPAGEELTITCTPGSNALKLDAQAGQLVITGWNDNPGSYVATLTASNGTLSTSVNLTYTLLENHAPKVVKTVSDKRLQGLEDKVVVPLNGVFSDEDGETLLIQPQADDPCVELVYNQQANQLELTAHSYGAGRVSVTATDFLGLSAELTFRVAVVDPTPHAAKMQEEVVSDQAVISVNINNATGIPVELFIYSSTGSLVYHETYTASAYAPIRLNTRALAPGSYSAKLVYAGETHWLRFFKY